MLLLLISILICRVNPTVLGTKPLSCEGHSAVLLKDRIIVLKKNPKPDDHTWFLEVSAFKPMSLI